MDEAMTLASARDLAQLLGVEAFRRQVVDPWVGLGDAEGTQRWSDGPGGATITRRKADEGYEVEVRFTGRIEAMGSMAYADTHHRMMAPLIGVYLWKMGLRPETITTPA